MPTPSTPSSTSASRNWLLLPPLLLQPSLPLLLDHLPLLSLPLLPNLPNLPSLPLLPNLPSLPLLLNPRLPLNLLLPHILPHPDPVRIITHLAEMPRAEHVVHVAPVAPPVLSLALPEAAQALLVVPEAALLGLVPLVLLVAVPVSDEVL